MLIPTIGEIRKASEIGYKGRAKLIWCVCPDCQKPRWQPIRLQNIRCWSCAAQYRARQDNPISYISGEPKVGDTALAKTLGYSERGIRYYDACPKCGIGHWVRKQNRNSYCVKCSPKPIKNKHPRWSGGKIMKRGYIFVHIKENDPMYSMTRNGWVLEHRLVMARSLNRVLTDDEVVHHKNGIKSDNRLDNLKLLTKTSHHSALVIQDMQEAIRNLENRITILEAENVYLKKVLTEVQDEIAPQYLNLESHNTPSNDNDIIEGIVQYLSNEGDNTIESA